MELEVSVGSIHKWILVNIDVFTQFASVRLNFGLLQVWRSSVICRTDHVTFAEYNNSGDGAAGSRASFSTKLSAPVSINTVLGTTSWIDSQFLL